VASTKVAVCLYFLISGGNNNASKKHKFTSINKELLQAESVWQAKAKLYRAIITRVCVSVSLSQDLGRVRARVRDRGWNMEYRV